MTGNTGPEKPYRQIGVDFSVSHTVIVASDLPAGSDSLACPGISRQFSGVPGAKPVHIIPSLVHYRDGQLSLTGAGVEECGLAGDPATARWLRLYVCRQSPVQIAGGGCRAIRYEEAARDFLNSTISSAIGPNPGSFTLAFSLPAEVPEGYTAWLTGVAKITGAASCTWIPECLAAAEGYGFTPGRTEPFLVVSFGETGHEVFLVMRDDVSGTGMGGEQGIRILGQAASSLGCNDIDSWIVRDVVRSRRLRDDDPRAERLAPSLLAGAVRARECAACGEETTFSVADHVSGLSLDGRFSAEDLDRILRQNRVIPVLLDTIDRALSAGRLRGYEERMTGAVLLIGSGCIIPFIRDGIRERFPTVPVFGDHPLDAVARGAARSASPDPAADRITCAYALRHWDPASQQYHYRFLAHSGTRFPSAGEVARIVISATYDGQTHLGIPIYEIQEDAGAKAAGIELISDTGGGMRLSCPVQDAGEVRQVTHANESAPTLLVATPPGRKGEPRFECTFTIDGERNLCLSARDLVTGSLVRVNEPVLRLK